MSERIPIHPGLYIRLSKDGRALHSGEPDSDVLGYVRSWLFRNQEHEHHQLVERWIEQKIKQLAADVAIQSERTEREKTSAEAKKIFKVSPKLKGVSEAVIRDSLLKFKGIPPEED